MQTALRRIGNSQGIIIPKPLLAQAGITMEVDLTVEQGAIVLRPPCSKPREGWAQASQALAAGHEDELVWPESGNAQDAALRW